MNIYDQTHALARALRETDEYKRFESAREEAFENDTNKTLLEEYRRLQFQLQVAMAGGGAPDSEAMEKYQRVAALLQLSPEASAYIMAELQLQRLLADMYKILGEAAGIRLDMLQS